MIYTGGAPGGPFEDMFWYRNDPDYNADIADATVEFFETYLTHTKGRWAGQPFRPLPWQEHRVIRPLFGILREQPSDQYPIGLRRFRKGYCEIPKKNGKSETDAGIGVKLFLGDHEAGAEVYAAAVDREQASIIHGVSASMIRNNEELNARAKIIDSRKRIIALTEDGIPTDSVYVALSADVPNKHGLNVHGCLFDELHAQPNSELWDILTEGSTTARMQSLIFAITTAGFDRESVCWKMREYAVRVLTGETVDPTFLPVIYGMDEDEDWESEENWKAVNPSMGTIFSLEDFRAAYREAKEIPYKQNLFRRLRLNQWTQQETRFLPMDKYDACNAPFTDAELASLAGRPCYGGADLSSVNDLTSTCKVFPMDDDTFWCLWRYQIPAGVMQEKIVNDRVPYDQWQREGWLETNPGESIDYNYTESALIKDREKYTFPEFGYDPYNATQFVNNMAAADFNMVMVRQHFLELSPPTKELLRLILEGKIRFGGNPISRWCADNMNVLEDNHGNIKPVKGKNRQKIDGMVALICALDCAIRHRGEYGPSVYETSSLI